MKALKKLKFILGVLAVTGIIAGCGAAPDVKEKPQEVKKVTVAIGNDFKPYCYLDEDGNLTGYDYEVLKAMDERLPQYTFEYNQLDFKNILLSVQLGKADVGAYQVEWNEEREKLFKFSKVPTDSYDLQLTVKKGRTDIQSMEDLKGKNVFAPAGTSSAYILNKYCEEHDNPFNLILSSTSDLSVIINNIDNGTWDTFIGIDRDIQEYNKIFGDKLQVVGAPIASSNAYHIFNNDAEQIKEDFEKALQELKDDGTLAKISKEVLGDDFTKQINE